MAKFYIVGGYVRDKLMGVKSKDIDYSVECESFDAMREEILARGGEIFLETPEYFTIRARVPRLGAADFVLCRKDGEYGDHRRPDKVEMGTIHDDLARRDFTMNAIAIDEEPGEYLDPFGGEKDIERGEIRCVGKVEDRFNEDALRILRAIRFKFTKKMRLTFEIRKALRDWQLVKLIEHVSIERVREEMLKIMRTDTIQVLRFLEEFPLIRDATFGRGLWLMPTLKE
jgi:tRNA nucleotidyltransferase (CCA-adding enzyme)